MAKYKLDIENCLIIGKHLGIHTTEFMVAIRTINKLQILMETNYLDPTQG